MARGWRYNRGQTEGEAEDPNEFLPPGSVGEDREETMQSEQGEIQNKVAHIEEILEQLSLTELHEVIELANEHRLNREMEARDLLLKEFRERAGQMGFQFEALFASTQPRRRNAGQPIAPKYRGPNGEVWSGRISPLASSYDCRRQFERGLFYSAGWDYPLGTKSCATCRSMKITFIR